MEGVDHRITHLHRSFQLQLRGCGPSMLHSSSPGSRSRRGGSASRHPRCPPRPPDGCACLGTRAQPPWELLEGARLVNRDTQIDTPSRTGKPEIKNIMKPPALHGFCSFSSLGEKNVMENTVNLTNLTQRKATCSPLSEFKILRS